MLVVIGTDCTGSCKSNYHMITTTTVPFNIGPYGKNNFVFLSEPSDGNLGFFFCFCTNYLKSLRRWMNQLGMVRQSGVDFNVKMTPSSYVIYIYLLGTRIYIIPFFLLTIHGQHLENDYYIHQITSKWQRCLDVTFIDKNKECHSTAGLGAVPHSI